ncbi:MAG TPA: hypothetical protein VH333_18535 [Pseudonocardiaceae bacterium]|jgi:hypothetical protein|nr:hypothetical protein [Pseudonocardiaceae bacterium]
MGRVAAAEQPDRRQRIIVVASQALAAAQEGDDGDAVERLIDFVRESHDEHTDVRELVLLLFAECSRMVTELSEGGATPVRMQVFDEEGQEVPIDEADPPVRTAVRTLLAEVHGDEDAAAEQVEIALSSAAPEEMATVVIQALRWTIRLATACDERDLPVPPWIAEALGH